MFHGGEQTHWPDLWFCCSSLSISVLSFLTSPISWETKLTRKSTICKRSQRKKCFNCQIRSCFRLVLVLVYVTRKKVLNLSICPNSNPDAIPRILKDGKDVRNSYWSNIANMMQYWTNIANMMQYWTNIANMMQYWTNIANMMQYCSDIDINWTLLISLPQI